MRVTSLSTALLLLVVGVTTACAPSSPPAGQPSQSGQTAQPAQTAQSNQGAQPTKMASTDSSKPLVFVDSNEPSSLYPPVGTGPFGTVEYALFDTLVNHNDKMEPMPGLAQSWEVASDKVTWTFKLKSGVKFHDGTDFNADAVKYNIEMILDPKTGAGRRSVYTVIKSVDVVDPLTVKITTTDAFPDLPFLLLDRSAMMCSPTALKKAGVSDFGLQPVGTGPFKFVEWVPNDHITLDANPDYWQGKPKVSRITYKVVPEAGARTAALRAGEADIVLNISPNDLDALKKDSNLDILQKDSMSQVTSEMRQTQKPFSDPKVRQAMNYAIDRKSIVNDIMHGVGRVADSPGPPNVWGSVNLPPYDYNPAKAKQLLTEAGYPNGFDGNLFYVAGRWAGDDQVTQAMQAYWVAVGINIKLQKVDNAGLDEMLSRDPDTMAGWTTMQIRTSTYIDYHLYRLFNSEASHMKGFQRSGYTNTKVDELLAKGRSTFDLTERKKYYEDAQKLIWDDAAFIWVFAQQNLLGARKGVGGYELLPTGDVRLFNAAK